MYHNIIKRFFEILLLLIFAPILLPIGLTVALLVYAKLGSPVIFRQERPGFQGEPFTILKFRTMLDSHDENGLLLSDAERLTSFGRFLRSTSLDELPELWNVFKGEMSLVGPRPLLMEYLPLYSPRQSNRHNTRPGITGWAQINGRNAISWEEKFDLDLWYIENQSFWLDLRILVATLTKTFKREGISQDGHVTMPKFMGPTQE